MDAEDSRTRTADDRPVVIRPDRPILADRPVVVTPPSPTRGRAGLRRAVLAGLVAGALLAAGLGAWWVFGGDDGVGTTAAQPPQPAPLSLDVTAPTGVVAGTPATVVVRYADGAGTFSGSTEEWGDGVGTSSLTEGRCGTARTDAAAEGTYRAQHTWSEPGTYAVKVAVSSYTCQAGEPVAEQASTTVTVVVAAR